MTLTEFLLARITEDETNGRQLDHYERLVIDSGIRPEILTFANSARVLAECEAKRRIVGRHQSSADTRGVGQHRDGKWTPYCEYDSGDWPCADIADLAAIYADHPDYRAEWRP